MIETFIVTGGPPAIGPYSHGVQCSGSMIFLSGQVALNAGGELIGSNAAEQTRQIFENIRLLLASRNASLSNVVKSTVFLQSMDDFSSMNEEYAKAFGEHRPARSAFQVARLPKDALVEIEVIACID